MSAADRPFINNATRKEREEALRESMLPTTYHRLGQVGADLDEPGGRFREKQTITGEQKAAQYPASSSPWSAQADPGLEPSLGYSVNDMEVCGEAHEIEQSLAAPSSDPAFSQQGAISASVGDDGGVVSDLAEDECSSGLTPAAVAPTLAVSSPASPERGPRPSLSTTTIKRRKL